jgi:hypothetical protein
MILVFIGVMVGLYFGTRQAIKMGVEMYTSTSPAEIPKLNLTAAEEKAILEKIQTEGERARAGLGPNPLVLDERELNVLLANTPALATIREHIYVQPEGTQLKAHMSLPLDQFEAWKELSKKILSSTMQGRYFNGTALLDAGVTNGTLNVVVTDLVVNNKSLPGKFTAKMQSQNFAAEANKDPNIRALMERIERIEVRDSKVYIYFKSTGSNLRV